MCTLFSILTDRNSQGSCALSTTAREPFGVSRSQAQSGINKKQLKINCN